MSAMTSIGQFAVQNLTAKTPLAPAVPAPLGITNPPLVGAGGTPIANWSAGKVLDISA